MKQEHYTHLAVMVALSFAAMYSLMYAMVYSIGDVFMKVKNMRVEQLVHMMQHMQAGAASMAMCPMMKQMGGMKP